MRPVFKSWHTVPTEVAADCAERALTAVKGRYWYEGSLLAEHVDMAAFEEIVMRAIDEEFETMIKSSAADAEYRKHFWPTGVRRSVPLTDDPEDTNDAEAPRGQTIDAKHTEKRVVISKQRERQPLSMEDALIVRGFEFAGTVEKTKVFKQAGTGIECALEGNTFVLGSDEDGVLAGGRGIENLTLALDADNSED